MKIVGINKFVNKDYEIIEKFDAGVVLNGSQVKSIKYSGVDLKDGILKFQGKELFASINIKPYSNSYLGNTNLKSSVKLLLTKKQLSKIFERTTKTGYALVMINIFINKSGLIKINLGLGKLLKKIEKKQILKEKQLEKEVLRDIKSLKN